MLIYVFCSVVELSKEGSRCLAEKVVRLRYTLEEQVRPTISLTPVLDCLFYFRRER